MGRIKIEDLPPADENLTPEELAEIEGAGRPSFRPTIETLENRELYAANLGSALTPGLQSLADAAKGAALVRQTPLVNEIPLAGLTANAATSPHRSAGRAATSSNLDAALFGGGTAVARADVRRHAAVPILGKVGAVNPLLAPSQAEANKAFMQHCAAWKKAYVTANGAGGHLRVQRTENGKDTVSEGIGYGMLLEAYNGDRATFDGLWGYAKAHLNSNGLMNWHLDPNGHPTDPRAVNAATDADQDMAMALVVADGKWGGYKADATKLINAIMTHEVETGTNVLKPGDVWGGSSQTNPSYFAPAYDKVFQQYTGDARWGAVADKAYEILNKAANPTTGLVPQWVNADGAALPGDPYGYDAMRTPWRIAMDAVWNNDPRAVAYLSKVNAFFKQQGVKNVYDIYSLNGQPQSRNHNAAAVSMASTAAIIDTNMAYRQSFWSETLVVPGNNYFNDSLRTLSLLLTGNLMTKP